MAKAMVLQAAGFRIVSGTHYMDLDVVVTDDKDWYTHINVVASAPSAKPLLGWQPIVRDAVILESQKQLSIVVDEVIFPDFTVLGVA